MKPLSLSFFSLCLFLAALFPLASQEAGEASVGASAEAAAEAAAGAADTTVYVIRGINFDITGRTRPYALRNHGRLQEGETFTGRAALDFYIRDRTQLLVNQRVLKDTVTITPTLGEPEADGRIPVDLLITVSDTWNIMVFPKPLWDSNDGFDLTLKGRDYNFFGTMSPLRLDLGYQLNTRKESNFNFLIDSDIPFTALGFNWNINFDNQFDYSWREALGYANTTGISMELPWRRSTFIFDISHQISWYDKNSAWERDQGYGKFFEGLINSIGFGVDWKIPTGLEVYKFGELTYTPKLRQSLNYNPGSWDMNEWRDLRRSYTTSFNQTLGFGRVDWIGNFRRGLEASFENENTYNYTRRTWNNSYSLNAAGHYLFSDSLGITSRLQFRHWFLNFPRSLYYDGGDVLRGVLDADVWADMMFSINIELPIRVLSARPSRWFKKDKMRIFNFEFFLSPTLDIGLAHLPSPMNGQKVLTPYYTGGLEALIFPDIMRSLYIRLSLGFDLDKFFWDYSIPSAEFFFGLGHFF
ncbi:MAG: hypothetical protein LBQ46_04325 [Treponema sp.]|nr:hypothetical protein [Treponema sp.]